LVALVAWPSSEAVVAPSSVAVVAPSSVAVVAPSSEAVVAPSSEAEGVCRPRYHPVQARAAFEEIGQRGLRRCLIEKIDL